MDFGTTNGSETKSAETSKRVRRPDDEESFPGRGGSEKIGTSNGGMIKKRRKCLRDEMAPRPPYSPYIQFTNDRREQLHTENPNLLLTEITKLLGIEWNQLPKEKKQKYILIAEQEQEKYVKELAAYKKTDAYNNFIQRKFEGKKLNSPGEANKVKKLEKEKPSNNTTCNIPFISEEFLNLNEAKESELRHLRKTVTNQTQEVSALNKHIKNINNDICKLTTQNEQLRTDFSIIKDHLVKIQNYVLSINGVSKLSDSTLMSSDKDEAVTTSMYDSGILQDQNPDQLRTTTEDFDFPLDDLNTMPDVSVIDSTSMISNIDEVSKNITYDPGIWQEQHPVMGQLHTTIEDFDFLFNNFDMANEVPVTDNISIHPAVSANGMTQTDETSYCFDVTTPFNFNYALVEQMALTTPSASFGCDICGAGFFDTTMLENHKRSVHPQNKPSFTCSTYGSCIPQIRDMNVHRSTVHEQCFSCGTKVAPQTMKDKKSRFVKCVICGVGNCSNYTPQENEIESNDISSSSEKTAIMKGYYPVKQRDMPEFDKCSTRNNSDIICLEENGNDETSVKNYDSNTPNKAFHCDIFGGSFSHYSSLWSLERLHTGDETDKCKTCGLSFVTNINLKNHGRVHTGEKPFQCSVCGMQFSQTTHLKDHERIHSGERPYKCKVCSKTFARCYTLRNHQRIHSGYKQYLCDKCGLAFIQASHLKNHAKVHIVEKPNRCDICGGRFRDRYSLKQHKNRHEKYAKQQSGAAAVTQTVEPSTQELEPTSGYAQIEGNRNVRYIK